MRRAVLLLASIACLLAASSVARAAGRQDEDRLRRRVKRFYVLNYLNRYGEMWEMFSADLQRRLGDDRRAYVRTSRESGFELYESRIDDLRLKGDVASVEVVLQAQLAGSLDVDSRRHRMLWRFEDGDWRYAGSVDVTHSEDEDAESRVELQPPGRAQAPEVEDENLLPRRVRVEAPSASNEARRSADESEAGERWDLVAVPPPGTSAAAGRESETERAAAAPEPAAPPEPATAGSPSAPARDVPALESEELLPPERVAVLPPPTEPLPPEGAPGVAGDLDRGTRLVRKAVSGLLPRRIRALDALERLDEPRLAPLMAGALPDAPAATAEVFLGEIARYEAWEQAPAVAAALDRDEAGVRAAAAMALRRVGGVEHAPRLERAVREERDDAARAEAVLSHAALAGASAGPVLAAVIEDERAGAASLRAAAFAAGRCPCPEVEEPLLRLAANTRFERVAAESLLSLGRRDGAAERELLERVARRELRPAAEADEDFDGVLEATRGLALGGRPGAGAALAALVLDRGMRAQSEDVVLVAGTGEREALLSLLRHPVPAVRRRTADLIGRVVDGPEDARAAREALAEALVEENDAVAFDAMLDARERLSDADAGRDS